MDWPTRTHASPAAQQHCRREHAAQQQQRAATPVGIGAKRWPSSSPRKRLLEADVAAAEYALNELLLMRSVLAPGNVDAGSAEAVVFG